MSRFVPVLALILMLLTGLVLGQMSNLGQQPLHIAARSDSGAAETARAFYRAINLYLETGDAQGLKQFLAPGFVGYAPHDSGTESAEEFLQYLESLRSTFPGLRLKVSDLSAQNGTVAMDVTLTGKTEGAFGGLPLDAGSGKSGYEVLRIEGRQIAERWGSRELPPLFQPIRSAELSFPRRGFPDPRIERLTIEPEGFGEFLDNDGFILIAESGEVTFQVVRLAAGCSTPVGTLDTEICSGLPRIGEQITLSPSESVVAPPGIRFRIGNNVQASTTVLMVSIRQAQFGPVAGGAAAYQVIDSVGLERTYLSGRAMDQVLHEERAFSVVIGRAVLPSGELIPGHETGAAEFLVMAEGSIEVSVHSGRILWTQPGNRVVVVDERQTISAGQGARANPGTVVDYRANGDEPATLWIVTMQSNEPEVPSEG